MNTTMKCYAEYGKMENDIAKLRTVIEIMTGRATSVNSKLTFLQTQINDLIQANSSVFLRIVTDEMFDTKVFIKECVEAGLISKRGDYYYLKSDGSQLCEYNEEPTLSIACKYINSPKHQDIKFGLEEKLKMK